MLSVGVLHGRALLLHLDTLEPSAVPYSGVLSSRRIRDFLTSTDQLHSWNHPKPARPVMIPVAELGSCMQEILVPIT